jgi:hypothetical protein
MLFSMQLPLMDSQLLQGKIHDVKQQHLVEGQLVDVELVKVLSHELVQLVVWWRRDLLCTIMLTMSRVLLTGGQGYR